LGGVLKSVAVVPLTPEARKRFDQVLLGQEGRTGFVDATDLLCYVGHSGQAEALHSVSGSSMRGFSALLLPLAVVALIVLNTMMGAVAERTSEIGVYSAIGLAPSHVAVLFLSESLVFATVGAVSGYLLGQLAAFAAAHFGWLAGLNLNYSSTSAVLASGLVMLTVLLSAIWPARRASRMSVPDVSRHWDPPPPQGEHWQIEFPFSVASYDITGITGFVARYFKDAPEGVLDEFSADGVRLETVPGGKGGQTWYRLSFRAWLAPFDLGVSQDVQVDFVPTGDFGTYEVHLTLRLVSGDRANWIRLNKRFFHLLRKRFLLWRVAPPEIKKMNVELTQELLGATGAVPATAMSAAAERSQQ
jgi:hypothetical protein